MAQTIRVDYEIVAAKLDMARLIIMDGVRNSTAVWNDLDCIRMIDRLSKEIDELYNYFLEQT